MTDVSGTSNDVNIQTTQTDTENVDSLTQQFQDMSVEDIMFLVLTQRAEEQKSNIESFAAQVQSNTLLATNINNTKAAIDKASQSDSGTSEDDINVEWENADGTTEEISLNEAYDRLGLSPDTSTQASTDLNDYKTVNSDQDAVDDAQAQADADIDDSTSLNQDQKELAEAEVGHEDSGFQFDTKEADGSWGKVDAETSYEKVQQDPDVYNDDYVKPHDATVGADIDTYTAANQKLSTDQSTLNSEDSKKIGQSDLQEMSANLGNAHDKVEGDNQIAMAQLQKDMDDYQTTLQTCQSSTDSMSRLSQKIGGSVGGG